MKKTHNRKSLQLFGRDTDAADRAGSRSTRRTRTQSKSTDSEAVDGNALRRPLRVNRHPKQNLEHAVFPFSDASQKRRSRPQCKIRPVKAEVAIVVRIAGFEFLGPLASKQIELAAKPFLFDRVVFIPSRLRFEVV